MNQIGFMQGRLTNKDGFYPQEFPEHKWVQEFYSAKHLGFDCIEWMFNEPKWRDNPIISEKECLNIVRICQETSVRVSGVCINYFMEKSIYNIDERESNCFLLDKLMNSAQIIGCKNLIIPLFEASEMQLDNRFIYEIVDKMPENDVFILFESNERLSDLKKWLSGFKRSQVGVCYDIGNAIGLGYNSASELNEYGDIVKNVHIKDKKIGGTTVMLGEGDACFEACFEALRKFSYTGCYILESYYYEAVRDTCQNLKYIKEKMGC